MIYSSFVSAIRNRVPSGKRDQSDAALITWAPERPESTMPATGLLRGRFRELACAIGATLRLERDLHRANRAVFLVRLFFGRLWFPKSIDHPDQKKNCARDNQKINHERDEVAVIPSDRSGFDSISWGIEYRRAVFGRSQDDELV